MSNNRGFIVLALVMLLGLGGCVVPPPRERVVYREGPSQAQPQYSDDSDRDGPSGRYCHACGTIRDLDRVEIRQTTTGGGAVLGAIIGGVIGNSFGRGGGRAAATAIGAVGGAAVGDSVERDNDRAASGDAWRFRVELDDGRWATVTQYDNPGFHPGDRVIVRGNHLEWQR